MHPASRGPAAGLPAGTSGSAAAGPRLPPPQNQSRGTRMAREERSAGVVLFRAERAAPPGDDGRLFLLLDYGRYWDYPKGHVEKGEDDVTAVLRELREETGIGDAQLVADFRHEITYFF